MAEVFDVSQWDLKPWYSTGGTRTKKYLQRPDGKYFYFKRSHFKAATENKQAKDYKFEFWSEIIAYEVGTILGFDVLRYDIAIHKGIVGCISEDMIYSDKEEFIEGVKYLQGFDNSFNPADRAQQRKRYSFQLIEAALGYYKFDSFMNEIIEILVFDAIIGNGDRHQENWAIIHQFPLVLRSLGTFERIMRKVDGERLWIPGWMVKQIGRIYDFKEKKLKPEYSDAKLGHQDKIRFAPLYDNGSSLGRELTTEKIEEYNNNPNALNEYVTRGKAEIHWDGEKLSHYDLLRKLLETKYKEQVLEVIVRVQTRYDELQRAEIISTVDKGLAQDYNDIKLPQERKAFIKQLITLRCQKLFALLP